MAALQQLSLWPAWRHAAHAIRHIHVSEKGHAGRVTMDADEFQLPALGYVLELSWQGRSCQQLTTLPNITHYCPSSLVSFVQSADLVTLTLSSEQISTRLLVGADGAQSVIP